MTNLLHRRGQSARDPTHGDHQRPAAYPTHALAAGTAATIGRVFAPHRTARRVPACAARAGQSKCQVPGGVILSLLDAKLAVDQHHEIGGEGAQCADARGHCVVATCFVPSALSSATCFGGSSSGRIFTKDPGTSIRELCDIFRIFRLKSRLIPGGMALMLLCWRWST